MPLSSHTCAKESPNMKIDLLLRTPVLSHTSRRLRCSNTSKCHIKNVFVNTNCRMSGCAHPALCSLRRPSESSLWRRVGATPAMLGLTAMWRLTVANSPGCGMSSYCVASAAPAVPRIGESSVWNNLGHSVASNAWNLACVEAVQGTVAAENVLCGPVAQVQEAYAVRSAKKQENCRKADPLILSLLFLTLPVPRALHCQARSKKKSSDTRRTVEAGCLHGPCRQSWSLVKCHLRPIQPVEVEPGACVRPSRGAGSSGTVTGQLPFVGT